MRTMIISGRCTSDAEIIAGKKEFIKVTIAVNEYVKKDKSEKTYFYDVLIFGKNLDKKKDIIKKGKSMVIFGKPEVSAYIDKEGNAKGSLSILANDWDLL